jgi:Asp-tRNA(Asn)/Glu-tRNA(Gln) amidotransferase A subunit family amidase
LNDAITFSCHSEKTYCTATTMWAAVLILAICIGLLVTMMEIPIRNDEELDPLYSIVELSAPALAGPLLSMFTYLAARTPARPFLVRRLLNTNSVHLLRQLASTMRGARPTYFPMARLSREDHTYHSETAHELNKQVLEKGITSPHSGGYRSIMDYRNLYKSRRATPSQVMDKVLEGMEKLQHLNMMRSIKPSDVRKLALEADARWEAGQELSLFDGVPVAFKDMVDIEGHEICFGSQDCHLATGDDVLVEKFRKAGAIILGTTVMTEGGVTPLGYSLWSDGPFNPYGTEYYCGGSSSGSAVLVASGLAPLAIGWDGGGSVRIPASMSGVMGLAMTFGRIEMNTSLHSTNIKGGPLTATVQDAALSHVFMSGSVDTSHFYSRLYDGGVLGTPPAHLDQFNSGVKGLRLGVYWDHFKHSDPEIVEQCERALEFLVQSGATIQNITIPYLRQIHLSHGIKILSEFAGVWDAQFYNPNITLEANTDITLLLGKEVTANEVLAAEKIRTWAIDWMRNNIFESLKIDAIVSPMLGAKVPKPKTGFRMTGESNTPLVYKLMRFVPLANFLGLPGMSVPIGYEKETGLPIGFQLMGDAWNEHKLLRIAAVLEEKFIQRRRPPPENFFDPLATWV